MNLTDDYVLKFQKGTPVLLDDICAIYPLTLGEIVDEGYQNFQEYLGVLTMTKPVFSVRGGSEFNEMIKDLTDFQYILLLNSIDKEINALFKKCFKFFTKENINFSLDPPQIIVGPIEEKHIMNEEKFYDFQSILKRMYFLQVDGQQIVINANDNQAVKKLKLKMRENREKVRRAKAKQNGGKSDLKFSDLIGSVTVGNCGLNMENIWNITYYAFHDQLKRMGWRDQFDINNRAAIAGAKLKKSQLQHWMRSIASQDKT